MRRAAFAVVLLLIAGGAATAAVGADEPRAWLERMVHALHSQNYEGTYVYVHAGHLDSMHIIHAVDAKGERERVYSLSGIPHEVLRNDHAVTSILPDSRAVFAEEGVGTAPFPAALGEAFVKLSAYYRFMMGGADRVAQRKTREIVVQPRDRYRYGYRLWLDDESALPLKADLVGHNGATLEQMMFTDIHLYDSIPEKRLRPQLGDPAVGWQQIDPAVTAAAHQPVKDSPWRVGVLPNGFVIRAHNEEEMPGNNEPVEHIMFSDGLASVSAYMEKMGPDKGLHGGSRRGAISAFGRQVGPYQVTVVGEVPQVSVKVIADAIHWYGGVHR